MAGNSVAANLLMFAIVALGLVSFTGLDREAWPVFPFNIVEINMAYPGANPEEVEEYINLKIEDEVRGLEDVKSVRSIAAPGMASVLVEMRSGTDMKKAMDDVESAVARVRTFPVEAERPQFSEMTNRMSAVRVLLHGEISDLSLKALAFQIEDGLKDLPEVSLVATSGARDNKISI